MFTPQGTSRLKGVLFPCAALACRAAWTRFARALRLSMEVQAYCRSTRSHCTHPALVHARLVVALLSLLVSNCTLCQAQAAVQSTTQFGTVQSTTQFGIASAAPSQPLVPLVGGAGAATVTSPSAETIAEVTTTSITNPEAMKKSDTSSEVVVPTNFQLPVPLSNCCTSLVAV